MGLMQRMQNFINKNDSNNQQELPAQNKIHHLNTPAGGRSFSDKTITVHNNQHITHDTEKPSNERSASALGLSAFVVTTADAVRHIPSIGADSVAKGVSASALNIAVSTAFSVVVTPLVAALLVGYFDYQLQLIKKTKDKNQELSDQEKQAIWEQSSKPLMYKMGAALFGAHAFTTVMQESGLDKMIAGAMCNLQGSMPWQIDMVMMIASGVGLALFLTGMTIYQNKKLGKPTTMSEIVATLGAGVLVGMGAYGASMIPAMNNTHGWNMPDWTAKIAAGVACGAVVTALFNVLPTATEKLNETGAAVSKKYTTWQEAKAQKQGENDKNPQSCFGMFTKEPTNRFVVV